MRGLKLKFSCKNLHLSNNESHNEEIKQQNDNIVISVCSRPNFKPTWELVGSTEIITNNRNPTFKKTIKINPNRLEIHNHLKIFIFNYHDSKNFNISVPSNIIKTFQGPIRNFIPDNDTCLLKTFEINHKSKLNIGIDYIY